MHMYSKTHSYTCACPSHNGVDAWPAGVAGYGWRPFTHDTQSSPVTVTAREKGKGRRCFWGNRIYLIPGRITVANLY